MIQRERVFLIRQEGLFVMGGRMPRRVKMQPGEVAKNQLRLYPIPRTVFI